MGKVCTRIRLETIMGIPFPNFPSETMEERGRQALRKKRIVTRKTFFLLFLFLDRTPSYVNIGYATVF